RQRHDAIASAIPTRTRSSVAAVLSSGRAQRLEVLDAPALPPTDGAPGLAGGTPAAELVATGSGERVVGLARLDEEAPSLVLITSRGTVKRVSTADRPARGESWDLLGLKEGDEVVAVAHCHGEDDRLVLVGSHGQLLHFPAEVVPQQGRAASGVLGMRLPE